MLVAVADDAVTVVTLFLGVNAVTMQAQRSAPSDMICKDKFLVQSTIVPAGTNDVDITPGTVSNCSHS